MTVIVCAGKGGVRCGHSLFAHGPKGCPWCPCRLSRPVQTESDGDPVRSEVTQSENGHSDQPTTTPEEG